MSSPTNHWGCAANEERSPFKTTKATCRGPVTYGQNEFGGIWLCEKHKDERAAREDAT